VDTATGVDDFSETLNVVLSNSHTSSPYVFERHTHAQGVLINKYGVECVYRCKDTGTPYTAENRSNGLLE
jgi:hypothetical protein